MGITVGLGALNFGFNEPGAKNSQTATSTRFLGPVPNLTASITGDANNVFSVISVTSFDVSSGVSLHGGESITTSQVAQTNGATPLSVTAGQIVEIVVQFVATAQTPFTCTAALQVSGDGLDNVSAPVSATVGEIAVDVPAITVEANETQSATVTVTLMAGPSTTATLAISPNPTTPQNPPPKGFLGLSATSVELSSGRPGTATLTVNPNVLTGVATGAIEGIYEYALTGTVFNGAYAFEAPIKITVELAYYVIKSKLGTVLSIAGASTQQGAPLVTAAEASANTPASQLWAFEPDPAGSVYYYIVSKLNGNVVDIERASKDAGAFLDAFPRKVADDGHSGSDNQLWYFVIDPLNSGHRRILSKLNGNAIDIAGGSTAPGTPVDSFPVKLTGAENQVWQVVGGDFPFPASTVPYDPGWGNGNVNYVMDGETEPLVNVSATIDFSEDLITSANGWSIQLNCYSSVDGYTVWQQYCIYADPGDGQFHAIVDTWTPTGPANAPIPQYAQASNINAAFMSLPNLTVPAGYRVTIELTYFPQTASPLTANPNLVTGAVFTVTDKTGHVAGTTSIQILGNTLLTTSQPASVHDLSPVTSFQVNLVGDYNSNVASLTQGAGTITYSAASLAESGITVTQQGPPGPFSVFRAATDTGENANVQYGPLPWPWSPAMTNVGTKFVQLFKVLPTGSSNKPWIP